MRHDWRVLVLRGAAAILFGALALLIPRTTVRAFLLAFGTYAVVDGVLSIAASPRRAPGEARWPLVLPGILSLVAGFVVILNLRASAVVLLYLAAVWAVATGVAGVVAAVVLRKAITGEWLLALSGALSVALGLVLLTRPAAGIFGFLWAIALYAIVAGVTLVTFGLQLRSRATLHVEGRTGKAAR